MTLWLGDQPLVLASRSMARSALLTNAGIAIEVLPADIDERSVEAKASAEDARTAAALLAREKARTVAAQRPGRFVLGADQTLALGQQRFSKPADRAAALEQLRVLRGKTHELHSAAAVMRDNEILFEHTDTARLTMRMFSDQFLEDYVAAASEAVSLSVGGYQLENLGVQLFERIEGDYFTVLGLPLVPLLHFLRRRRCLAE